MKSLKQLSLALLCFTLESQVFAFEEIDNMHTKLPDIIQTHMKIIQRQIDKDNIHFKIDQNSIHCVEVDSAELQNPIGACTFSASGTIDSIDAIFAVTIGDPIQGSPNPTINVILLSTAFD